MTAQLPSEIHYIAIEGVIGVGKTTLARMLSDQLGARLILEKFEENPFLPNFYKDPEHYAFQTQIFSCSAGIGSSRNYSKPISSIRTSYPTIFLKRIKFLRT